MKTVQAISESSAATHLHGDKFQIKPLKQAELIIQWTTLVKPSLLKFDCIAQFSKELNKEQPSHLNNFY